MFRYEWLAIFPVCSSHYQVLDCLNFNSICGSEIKGIASSSIYSPLVRNIISQDLSNFEYGFIFLWWKLRARVDIYYNRYFTHKGNANDDSI